MKFSVNMMQLITILWTAIAVMVALVVVIGLFAPKPDMIPFSVVPSLITPGVPWQVSVLMFFLFLLVLVLPVYLLLFLWHRLAD